MWLDRNTQSQTGDIFPEFLDIRSPQYCRHRSNMCVLGTAKPPPAEAGGLFLDISRFMALYCEIEPLSCVHVKHLLPSGTDPLGRDTDEASDEALETACGVEAFEILGNCLKNIQIEVLEHCGNQKEHGVLLEV